MKADFSLVFVELDEVIKLEQVEQAMQFLAIKF